MARSERAPARAPRRSKYAVEKSLVGSLDSTIKGLEQLLASLQGTGFAEGLSSYRTLQAVLVQQRLWALTNQRALVLPKFRPIARTAEKLHRIFAGYAAVMDTLSKLDELTEATAPPLVDDAETEPAAVPGETPPSPVKRPTERRNAARGR